MVHVFHSRAGRAKALQRSVLWAGLLTLEGNGCFVVLCLLCLLQVQQGGCKEGVVDEVFHVMLLTLLLGLGTHLVGYILPEVEREGGLMRRKWKCGGLIVVAGVQTLDLGWS